jgi:hypothetical protein
MTFAALVSLVLSLARAFPLFAKLLLAAAEAHRAEREREATQRLEDKNTAVDRAIDAPSANTLPRE